MDDTIFLIFLFGVTILTFFVLSLISYLVINFIQLDDDSEDLESHIPNNIKINPSDYNTLRNFDRFKSLSDNEKIIYLLTVAYCKQNQPHLLVPELNTTKVTTESLLIRDRGISAYHFTDYYDQITSIVEKLSNETDDNDNEFDNIDETTSLLNNNDNIENDFTNNQILTLLKKINYNSIIPKLSPFLIEDLAQVNFKPSKIGNILYSTVLNLPIPTVNRKNNVTYFECKLLEFDLNSTLVSLGLVTDPKYPNFQLPGFIPYSFAIESHGNLRMTNSNSSISSDEDLTIILPQLKQGDVIGLGYRAISGTIFITHNGKLIHEVVKYFKFQLYPCIGYKNLNSLNRAKECKISVNFGQLGFVYIEANVKKLGFCENKNDGLLGAPPIYNKQSLINEILLDKGDDIPPEYPNEENTFFGPVVGSSTMEKNGDMEVKSEPENENENEIEDETDERSQTPESAPPSYESEKKDNDMTDQEYENKVSTMNEGTLEDELNSADTNINATINTIRPGKGKKKAKGKKNKRKTKKGKSNKTGF